MAFANFFEKAAMSVASLVRGVDASEVRRVLNEEVVGVKFDERAALSCEGRWALELLVDLLARLYPRVVIAPHGTSPTARADMLAKALHARARAINNTVELIERADAASIQLAIGDTRCSNAVPTFYAGSKGWVGRVSSTEPVGVGDTANPFGAGVAACFAAAVIFRSIFQRYLAPGSILTSDAPLRTINGGGIRPYELSISALDLSAGAFNGLKHNEAERMWPTSEEDTIDIGDATLVGAGAIGNGTLWALSRTPHVRGTLRVVDGESLDLTNLQRYVLTTQRDVGASKVAIAAREFENATNSVVVVPHHLRWAQYVSRQRGDYTLDRVLLALDSAGDRISVQASLPRWIANAWTQPENCGVSRHEFLGTMPCVACLYFPASVKKSKDALYADALRVKEEQDLMEIRKLLHSGKAVGRSFLERLSARLGVPLEALLPYELASLEEFYTRAVCGGLMLTVDQAMAESHAAEVPMAFQSALAGILLAIELLADAGSIRSTRLPARSEINVLQPSATRYHSPAMKHPSGRCICQDPVFQQAYKAKYGYTE